MQALQDKRGRNGQNMAPMGGQRGLTGQRKLNSERVGQPPSDLSLFEEFPLDVSQLDSGLNCLAPGLVSG